MMVAAKTLTLTGIDLFKDPALIEKAKAELQQRRGPEFKYIPLLGDREPAIRHIEYAEESGHWLLSVLPSLAVGGRRA